MRCWSVIGEEAVYCLFVWIKMRSLGEEKELGWSNGGADGYTIFDSKGSLDSESKQSILGQ